MTLPVDSVQRSIPKRFVAAQQGRSPGSYGQAEFWGHDLDPAVFIIPGDVAVNSKACCVAADSIIHQFELTASNGAGRKVLVSNDRPLIGNINDACRAQGSDIYVRARDWHAKADFATIAGGTILRLRTLTPAQIDVYSEIPAGLDHRRSRYNGQSLDQQSVTLNVGVEEIVAVIPVGGRKACSVFVRNRDDLASWEWRVESWFFTRGISHASYKPQIDPYPTGVNTLAAAPVLGSFTYDCRFFTNLNTNFLVVYAKPIGANSGGLNVGWEANDD